MVIPQPSMSVLRIESARNGKDDATYECVAENGVGDAVTASAKLSIYPGKMHLGETCMSGRGAIGV